VKPFSNDYKGYINYSHKYQKTVFLFENKLKGATKNAKERIQNKEDN